MAPSADPIASKIDDLRIARSYLRDGWFVCRDEEEAKWWKGFTKREERRGLDGTGKAYHFYLDQQMNTLGHRMSNADYAVAKFLETHPSHPRRQEILYKESLCIAVLCAMAEAKNRSDNRVNVRWCMRSAYIFPNTVKAYEDIVEEVVLPLIGDRRVSEDSFRYDLV